MAGTFFYKVWLFVDCDYDSILFIKPPNGAVKYHGITNPGNVRYKQVAGYFAYFGKLCISLVDH